MDKINYLRRIEKALLDLKVAIDAGEPERKKIIRKIESCGQSIDKAKIVQSFQKLKETSLNLLEKRDE